jgi:hypothetical protein
MSRGPLYLPASVDDIRHVAVCAGRTSFGVHAGILYRDSASDTVTFLDLSLEGVLSSTRASNAPIALTWAIPQLDTLALGDAAAFCEQLASTTPRIPYSFKLIESTRLIATGHEFSLKNANGLTCATFVLAVFQSIGLPLIDLPSWQHRPEDEQWQRRLMQYIAREGKAWGLSDTQIADRNAEIPCLRYRPEEVVGACLVGNHASHWDETVPAGADVLRWITQTREMLAGN